MEKYSKAVSEMYSQFNQREVHPLERYVGQLVSFSGEKVEVVGYSRNILTDEPLLIIDASQIGGWDQPAPEPFDVVFKECKYYRYISINDLRLVL